MNFIFIKIHKNGKYEMIATLQLSITHSLSVF